MKKLYILLTILGLNFCQTILGKSGTVDTESFCFFSYDNPILKHRMEKLIRTGQAYATYDDEGVIRIFNKRNSFVLKCVSRCVLRSAENDDCLVTEKAYYDKDGNFRNLNIEAQFPVRQSDEEPNLNNPITRDDLMLYQYYSLSSSSSDLPEARKVLFWSSKIGHSFKEEQHFFVFQTLQDLNNLA